VCDLETSRMGAPYIYIYIYDISRLRVKKHLPEAREFYCLASKVYVVILLKLPSIFGSSFTACSALFRQI